MLSMRDGARAVLYRICCFYSPRLGCDLCENRKTSGEGDLLSRRAGVEYYFEDCKKYFVFCLIFKGLRAAKLHEALCLDDTG
jgi:hypothetical protein